MTRIMGNYDELFALWRAEAKASARAETMGEMDQKSTSEIMGTTYHGCQPRFRLRRKMDPFFV